MRIRLSYAVASSLALSTVATAYPSDVVLRVEAEVVATVTEQPRLKLDVAAPRRLLVSAEVLPLTPLSAADNYVYASDVQALNIQPAYTDDVTVSDVSTLEFDQVLADSVTVTESTFKIVTNPVDFDPSDDDVDPTPVTMSDSDAKTLSRPDVADAFTVSDLSYSDVGKQLTTSLATPTDAVNDFTVGKVLTDSITASEAINKFDVTTAYTDSVSVTEATAKDVTPGGKTDSVEMLGSNIKLMNSSVDFDPSDDDVDPDPITATDAINTFGLGKGLTDTATMAETSAKSLTRPNVADSFSLSDSDAKDVLKPFSDTVGATEGIKNNPDLGKTDTATVTDAITKFDPRLAKTDSFSLSDAVNTFAQNKALSDTVSITDVAVKNFTENVDYDRNDADADADPVTIGDSPAWSTSKVLADAFSLSDALAKAATKPFFDTVTATESIYTLLTLGESSYVYPDRAVMSDGDSPFLDLTYEPFTGLIGGPGYVNQVVVNSSTITYPDVSGAGLVVNFYYTDASDRTVGGHMFNQTPIL